MIENIDFQKLWDNRFPIIKIIGVVFLIIYLIFTPFSFELIWLLMALLLSFGAVLLYLLTIVTFQKELDRTVLQKSEENKLSEYPWTKYLVSAEDGVFLLPLFIIGINPVTVLITTVFSLPLFKFPKNFFIYKRCCLLHGGIVDFALRYLVRVIFSYHCRCHYCRRTAKMVRLGGNC